MSVPLPCYRHGCERSRSVRTAGTFHMFCGAGCDSWLSVAHAVSRNPNGGRDAKRLLQLEEKLNESPYLSRDDKGTLTEIAERYGVALSARSYRRANEYRVGNSALMTAS
ncbi:hypothetical protein SSP35_15_00760 [Streptomyces sp. NBRC 110611]|nr:hypothetical protein SSP35_15_00760 [Streptomyces sp. NBRC 110611]